MLCKVCADILWKPMDCTGCNKTFCQDCSEQKENESPCPFGCIKGIKPSTKRMKHLLAKFQFKCKNFERGCGRILEHQDLEPHEQICGFSVINCEFCNSQLLSSNVVSHLSYCLEYETK